MQTNLQFCKVTINESYRKNQPLSFLMTCVDQSVTVKNEKNGQLSLTNLLIKKGREPKQLIHTVVNTKFTILLCRVAIMPLFHQQA